MQKKLIALAVAGLASSAAMAQVTVYGLIDTGYFSVEGGQNTPKFSGLRTGLSGSRIGFKGSEDLGNGLSAVALLETTVNQDAGASFNTTGRQSYVGLSSTSVGTVLLGRLYSPGYNHAAKFDANSTSTFSPVSLLQQAGGATITANGPGRLDNTMGYASPNFGGVTFGAAYSFAEESAPGTLEAGRIMGFNVDYTAGPLSVGVAYHSGSDVGGRFATAATPTALAVTAQAETDITEVAIGGSYDLGVAKIVATYQTVENEPSLGGAATIDRTIMSIGASFPVGSGVIKASYAMLDDERAGATNRGADSIGVEYNHMLSKRTTAYAGYSTISNEANATFGGAGVTPAVAGEDVTILGLGLRHAF